MKTIEWMAKNPVAANLLMVILLIGGLSSLQSIQQEVFPEFDFDIISVAIPYKGATPSEIEESIVIPTEKAIEGIQGIKKVSSNAYEGAGRLTIDLDDGVDADSVLDDVKTAIDSISTYPENADSPTVNMVRRRREVLNLVIFGIAPEQSLREIAETVKNDLLADPSITQIDLAGIRDYEISIEISQTQLRRYQISIAQISNAIQDSTLDLPGGTLKTSSGDVLIRTKSRRYNAEEYGEIPIISTDEGQLLLRDIATITDSFEEVETTSTFNGKPSVLLDIYRVGDQTPSAISTAVRDLLPEVEERLPSSVEIQILNDRSTVLDDRIDLLVENAGYGLILVLALLTMFLRWKLAFWISMGIPISFLGAILLMPSMGVSINMISLFAFILVLGLVVDDAIIVGENIYAHQQMGKSKIEASVQGAYEIGGPVLFAILTTVVAFMPILFIVGTMGKFMSAIPLIVIAVLLMSLIECLYILPAHLAHSKTPQKHIGLVGKLEDIRNLPALGLKKFTFGPYQKLLSGAIEYRYVTMSIGVFMLCVGAGAVIAGQVRFTFFPRIDSDRVIAAVTMPFGTPISVTEKVQERLVTTAQELLAEYDIEKGTEVSKGIFSTLGGLGGRGNRGSHLTNARVYLEPLDVRGFSAREFSNRWRQKVGNIPGAESITFRFSTGPGGSSDLNIRLIHPDPQMLETIVPRLKNALSEYTGVSDIEDSSSNGKPEIQLNLEPEGSSIGMTVLGLTQQVRAAFQGTEVLRLQRGNDEVTVMLRYPLEERKYQQDLEKLMVQTPTGGEVPLARVAQLQYGRSFSEIRRIDGKRVISVTAKVDHKVANTEEITAGLKSGIIPELTTDYPNLEYSFSGRRDRTDSLVSLRDGAWFSAFLIFCLLALQFKSYFQPLVVMFAIPFGFIGALFGHWLMGYDLSLVSMLGLVALSGIVVNDSLILVDFINKGRASGMPLHDAVVQAGLRRFRPIMLTSLTTFFGLLPMIFETSLQARFLIPMAISLGFGVMMATFITLLLIPAMYLVLEDILSPFRKLYGSQQPPNRPTGKPNVAPEAT